MAVIDSKKLLPPDKRTGAITTQKFLVPVKNLQIKPQAELPSGDDLKPVESGSENTLLNTVLEIEKKVIRVETLIKSSSLLQKNEIERKRSQLSHERTLIIEGKKNKYITPYYDIQLVFYLPTNKIHVLTKRKHCIHLYLTL